MFIFESTSHYLHWGWVQISVANLIVIAVMLVIFAAAVAFQMPAHRSEIEVKPEERRDDDA